MDQPCPRPAEGAAAGNASRPPWALAWLALLGWQLWLTVGLFGSDPFACLADDRPIVNGAHPQNLYIGMLGAQSYAERGTTNVYDPNFQDGYLKTPIFDGSRSAELFLILGGGTYQPAAYKIGLAVSCMLVPLLVILACRSAGLCQGTTFVATALAQVVWWGPLGRGALEAGDTEMLLASLAGLAHVGCLISFHRQPGVLNWLGMLATACLAWFLQPLLFPIALPLLLGYYLSVGVKHSFLTWHTAFWLAQQGAVLVNLPWLMDWVGYWWLRSPLPSAANEVLAHRNFINVWNAPLWGGDADRLLTVAIMACALVGVVILNQSRRRPAARLFGMGAAGALTLALLGIAWEPLGQVGTAAMLAPALFFAVIPAAHACVFVACTCAQHGNTGRIALLLMASLAGLGVYSKRDTLIQLADRCTHTEPLTIGLNPERQGLVDRLIRSTTKDARILWEDRSGTRKVSRWAALLPILTERSFVGGLDPEGTIEPSSICLMNQELERRPIASWSDAELDDYSRRYNIGWLVAWSPPVIERFGKWAGAEKLEPVHDETDGWLFKLKRAPSYTLRGKAELAQADSRFIALKSVEPVNGEVVLSLHYQAGMRASPSRVQIEREPSGEDPIGFVRLRLADPAAWVTITWTR